jgi:nucleoside-diphosphate-sugar epimerase
VKALVTGASGFIGGVVCARMREQGHEVIALVRRPGAEPPGTTAVHADIATGAGLSEALARARPDCVLHLAAEIASQRSEERLREVNVRGTRQLVDACRAVGGSGPRVVFASTVVTGQADGAVLTEERPLPVTTPYGRSKQEGERIVLESGLPAIVVRPSHVYGSGGWYAQELVARLRQPGRLAVVGSGSNLWDVVHVEDVAQALVLASDAAAPAGVVYHVVDDEPITYFDFMALTAAELGVAPPRRVPAVLARLLAGRNAVDALVRSARSSNARIRRELAWEPRFPTARTGVPAAVAGIAPARGG